MTEWRITDPAIIRILASPVRQDIVDTLASAGEMGARQLAAHLGARPSALYYHLELLERNGLVRVVSGRRPDGREERRYRVPADRLELVYDSTDASNREAVTTAVGSILRLAERDFERGFSDDRVTTVGPGRNLWGARGKAWLSREDLAAVNAHLGRIARIFDDGAPGEGRQLCALTWVITPVTDRSGGPALDRATGAEV